MQKGKQKSEINSEGDPAATSHSVVPERLRGFVDNQVAQRTLKEMPPWKMGEILEWDNFRMNALNELRTHFGQWKFYGTIPYEGFHLTPQYTQRFGLMGHREHQALRLLLDSRKLPMKKQQVEPQVPVVSFLYHFRTVKMESFEAVQGVGEVFDECDGKRFFSSYSLTRCTGTPVAVPLLLQERLYARQVAEAKQVLSQHSFRDQHLYKLIPWYSALYSYHMHSMTAALVTYGIEGSILMPGDAVGLVPRAIASDIYPSPYSIGPVLQQTLSEVISSWGEETLVLMYVTTFLTPVDWEKINRSTAPIIIVDVVSVPCVGSKEVSPGYITRTKVISEPVVIPEISDYQDPPFTENLIDHFDTSKKRFLFVTYGNAFTFLRTARPKARFYVSVQLLESMQKKGYDVVSVPEEDYRKYTLLLEGFPAWFQYKKGYFVPSGMISPPMYTVRSQHSKFQTRCIYHVDTMPMFVKMSALDISCSFSPSGKNAYFVFSRECQKGQLEVVSFPVKHSQWTQILDGVSEVSILLPGSMAVYLRKDTELNFMEDISVVRESVSNREFKRVRTLLLGLNSDRMREWVKAIT